MPEIRARRRMLAALAIAVSLPLLLTSCSVIDSASEAGKAFALGIRKGLNGADEKVSDEGNTIITMFVAGDCVNDAATGQAEQVASLDSVDCTKPHDSEVVGSAKLDPGVFPGDDAIRALADPKCRDLFESWTGGPYDSQPELEYDFYPPTEDGWSTGDFEALCVVYASGQITGTTKGIATNGKALSIGKPSGYTVSDSGSTQIGDLVKGECIDDAAIAADSTIDEIRSFDTIDCAREHDAEIIGTASISNEAYFTDDDVLYYDSVDTACRPLFEAWTGAAYDEVPNLDFGFYLVPTVKSRLDTYEGVCTIYDIDNAKLTGTSKGVGIGQA